MLSVSIELPKNRMDAKSTLVEVADKKKRKSAPFVVAISPTQAKRQKSAALETPNKGLKTGAKLDAKDEGKKKGLCDSSKDDDDDNVTTEDDDDDSVADDDDDDGGKVDNHDDATNDL